MTDLPALVTASVRTTDGARYFDHADLTSHLAVWIKAALVRQHGIADVVVTAHPQNADEEDREIQLADTREIVAKAEFAKRGSVVDGTLRFLLGEIDRLRADVTVPASSPADRAAEISRLRDELAEAEERSQTDDRVMDRLNRTICELRTGQPACPDPIECSHEAALGQARETNRRLNYRAQLLESELATYRRAVSQWQVSDRGTYIPLRTISAIAKAAGRDIEQPRWILHYHRVEQAEAVIAQVRRLHDRLAAETDLASPDDEITRGAAAKLIATALDAASGPGGAAGETQQDETQAEPGTCGHRSSEGHPCTQPSGHLGYHRNSRQHGNEWTSWVGDTPATSTDTEECCGAEPPEGWPGDCWCTLPPEHPGDHQCTPCSNRHDAPGWTEQPAAVAQPSKEA